MPIGEILSLVVLGLAAGLFGGLLGIGGSIIMIPVLTVFLHRDYHLAQAAAMIVNFFVAFPAVLRHARAKAVRGDLVLRMLPFGIFFILIGVFMSNMFEGRLLEFIFGIFLVYVIIINVRKMFRREREPDRTRERVNWVTGGIVGSLMGYAAGLLGIGGGGLAVPLLQRVCHLPLRVCIANSAAVMCLTSLVGAFTKNITLGQHLSETEETLMVTESLLIAVALAPTAVIGGLIGASLTHTFHINIVRIAFLVLIAITAAKMLRLI